MSRSTSGGRFVHSPDTTDVRVCGVATLEGAFLELENSWVALAFIARAARLCVLMTLRPFFAAILVSVLSAETLLAEVVHVRDYQSSEPRDRGVLFAFAVTPDQDALSFVAKGDGRWRLTRIHGWLEKKPTDQSIDIPGWPVKKATANDPEFLSFLDIDLFVTADGRYAVCVAAGHWAFKGQRGGRSDNLVSVVDLRAFGVTKTIRTSEVGQESWQPYMNPSGPLAIIAETSPRSNTAAVAIGINGAPVSQVPPQKLKLVLLGLPGLSVQGECRYSEERRGEARTVEDEDGGCDAILGHLSDSPVSLRQYLDSLEDSHGFPLHRPALRKPCPATGVTRDRRFEKESCEKFHLSLWNRNYVRDKLTENVLSLETGKQVGTVEEATNNTVQSRFADQNGHYYLLVIEGGTKLKVYEIKA
jgi:hypothetical protein